MSMASQQKVEKVGMRCIVLVVIVSNLDFNLWSAGSLQWAATARGCGP